MMPSLLPEFRPKWSETSTGSSSNLISSSSRPSLLARIIHKADGRRFVVCLAFILSVCLLHTVFSFSALAWEGDISNVVATWPETSGKAYYPTWFTRDIMPKPIHSHNDYWRKVPFLSALEVGAISIEADVWLYNDELYVGHDTSSLTPNRTFKSLYVNPILSVLEKQNPKSNFTEGETKYGLFDTDPYQTTYLWIDVKTNGESTWPVVMKHLQPLREKGYLSYVNGTRISNGAITVIGTGNSPYDLMMNQTYRDYFIDAPLALIGTDDEPKTKDGLPKYTNLTSVFASTPFGANIGSVLGGISKTQKEKVKAMIKRVEERGIKARYWDLPSWPISRRNQVWSFLSSEGIGLLNVDDLHDASFGDWQ